MRAPRVVVDRSLRGQVAPADLRQLARVARRAGRRLGLGFEALANLGLALIDDRAMTALHQRHLGYAKVTDVLSFGAAEPDDLPMDVGAGDVVLDWQQVGRQAPGPGAAARRNEAAQLVVHGLVHLCGYDHGTRRQARAMLRRERAGARAAGLPRPRRPYG